MLTAMAWRNLWRHRRRTLITAGALAVSMAFVLALFTYMDGTYRAMSTVMVDQTIGHVQVHHPGFQATRSLRLTVADASARRAALDALPEVRELVPRLEGYALLGGADRTSGGLLLGVDPAVERAQLERRVVKGRFLADAPAREIVLGQGLARSLAVGEGDEVVAVTQAADGSLGNDLYRVVGVVASGTVAQDRSGAWVHLADLQELLVLPDQVHSFVVLSPSLEPRVDDPVVNQTLAAVRGVVGSEGVDVVSWWEASPQTAKLLGISDGSAWIVLCVVFGVAGLGVLNTMLMSVFERTRELGVMKALGTRPAVLVRLVLIEALILGLLSVAGGLALGGLFDLYLTTKGFALTTGDGDRLSTGGVFFDDVIRGVVKPERIVAAAVFLLGVAVLSAVWPAVRAARLDPVDAMQDR